MMTYWGREIPVNGVRPAWLADGVRPRIIQRAMGELAGRAAEEMDWRLILAIRLPADHFAYLALDKGFEPWGGGDQPPADWDGDRSVILYRDGNILGRFPHVWRHSGGPSDIIGYRKRADVAPVDWTKPIEAHDTDGRVVLVILVGDPDEDGHYEISPSLDGGDYKYFMKDGAHAYGSSWRIRNRAERPVTDDTVTIKRMTEVEAQAWLATSAGAADRLTILRNLGLIREETVAERFTRETGHEATPAVLAALVFGR